ncbi:MAG: LuxR family transcriptional regulator [Rhizobiaceae bacterium]|nr:LuxR family transcriptional regulator [Rhizobiaceae bacterium]
MSDLAARYGLKTAAYFGTGFAGPAPVLAVTYSAEWIEHYIERQFVEIDPVIQLGFRRLLPLDWRDFDCSDNRIKTLFGEASEFGFGKRGLSIPVHGRHGDRGLLSITSDLSERDWVREKLLYLRDFQVLAMHIHGKLLQLEGHHRLSRALSPRELECLQWIAQGKTAWECAKILGLSQHTVRCYLESARHKLNATSNTHAVSIAHKAGLFFDPL